MMARVHDAPRPRAQPASRGQWQRPAQRAVAMPPQGSPEARKLSMLQRERRLQEIRDRQRAAERHTLETSQIEEVEDAVKRLKKPRNGDAPAAQRDCALLCRIIDESRAHFARGEGDYTRHLKPTIVDGGGVEALIAAMRSHPTVATVQRSACTVLSYLARGSPNNAGAVVAAGGVDAIAAALRVHQPAEDVQGAGCDALWHLAGEPTWRNAGAHKDAIIAAGGRGLAQAAVLRLPVGKWAQRSAQELVMKLETVEVFLTNAVRLPLADDLRRFGLAVMAQGYTFVDDLLAVDVSVDESKLVKLANIVGMSAPQTQHFLTSVAKRRIDQLGDPNADEDDDEEDEVAAEQARLDEQAAANAELPLVSAFGATRLAGPRGLHASTPGGEAKSVIDGGVTSLEELASAVAASVEQVLALPDADLVELLLCPNCVPRSIARGRVSGGEDEWWEDLRADLTALEKSDLEKRVKELGAVVAPTRGPNGGRLAGSAGNPQTQAIEAILRATTVITTGPALDSPVVGQLQPTDEVEVLESTKVVMQPPPPLQQTARQPNRSSSESSGDELEQEPEPEPEHLAAVYILRVRCAKGWLTVAPSVPCSIGGTARAQAAADAIRVKPERLDDSKWALKYEVETTELAAKRHTQKDKVRAEKEATAARILEQETACVERQTRIMSEVKRVRAVMVEEQRKAAAVAAQAKANAEAEAKAEAEARTAKVAARRAALRKGRPQSREEVAQMTEAEAEEQASAVWQLVDQVKMAEKAEADKKWAMIAAQHAMKKAAHRAAEATRLRLQKKSEKEQEETYWRALAEREAQAAELAKMWVGDLRKKALALGVSELEIERARDADDPQSALAELVLLHSQPNLLVPRRGESANEGVAEAEVMVVPKRSVRSRHRGRRLG